MIGCSVQRVMLGLEKTIQVLQLGVCPKKTSTGKLTFFSNEKHGGNSHGCPTRGESLPV